MCLFLCPWGVDSWERWIDGLNNIKQGNKMPQGRSVRLHRGDNIWHTMPGKQKFTRKRKGKWRKNSCKGREVGSFLWERLREGKWGLLGTHWRTLSSERTVPLFGVAEVWGIWNGSGFWKDRERYIICKEFELDHQSNTVRKGFAAGVLIRITFWQKSFLLAPRIAWK